MSPQSLAEAGVAVREKYILAGDLFVSTTPYNIKTLLGSCVSVCIRDKYTGAAGMTHFSFPVWDGRSPATNRYGDISTKNLISRMISLGSSRESLEAKIVGGASPLSAEGSAWHTGLKNIDIARKVLDEQGIHVVSSLVGGDQGYRILFSTIDGKVHISRIKNTCKAPGPQTGRPAL